MFLCSNVSTSKSEILLLDIVPSRSPTNDFQAKVIKKNRKLLDVGKTTSRAFSYLYNKVKSSEVLN